MQLRTRLMQNRNMHLQHRDRASSSAAAAEFRVDNGRMDKQQCPGPWSLRTVHRERSVSQWAEPRPEQRLKEKWVELEVEVEQVEVEEGADDRYSEHPPLTMGIQMNPGLEFSFPFRYQSPTFFKPKGCYYRYFSGEISSPFIHPMACRSTQRAHVSKVSKIKEREEANSFTTGPLTSTRGQCTALKNTVLCHLRALNYLC